MTKNEKRTGETKPLSSPLPWKEVGLLASIVALLFLSLGWQSSRQHIKTLEAEVSYGRESAEKLQKEFEEAKDLHEHGRVLPGLSKELEELLALTDEQLEKADVFRLNLLVAKGLPECKDLDVAVQVKQLDVWAADVKVALAAARGDFEADKAKWKTRQRFEMTVMGSVLKERHGIRYVEQLQHDKSEQKFAFGILNNGTGTCCSLPVIWTAVGRRLGCPIRIAAIPSHYYCIFDDGADRFNIEATSGSHLGIIEFRKRNANLFGHICL